MMPIKKSIIVGIITIVTYLSIVVITIPALEPLATINAAFQLNSTVIIGIGLQVFSSEKSKRLECNLNVKKKAFGAIQAVLPPSFFSFFSLVILGYCGWWLYALSFASGIVGTGASAILIEHSQVLVYLGLVVVFGFAVITTYKLRAEIIKQRITSINQST